MARTPQVPFINNEVGLGTPVLPSLPPELAFTQGNIWHVKPNSGSDVNNSGKNPASAFKTLAKALAAAVANRNDIVLLYSEGNTPSITTDYLSSTLDWNKDGVHLIGVNSGSFLGQRSGVATSPNSASFANLFKLSAKNCLIQNILFLQSEGTTDPSAASTAFTLSGDRNKIKNCQISGIASTLLDDAGSNSLTLSGSENLFENCYIGLDTVIRGTAAAEVKITGGARNTFKGCHFETYTSLGTTNFNMITIAAGCDRFIKFIDCDFNAVQNLPSSAAPSGVIGITTMNGSVLVKNPFVSGFANITAADNAYVLVLGLNGVATGHLIGISQAVDVA